MTASIFTYGKGHTPQLISLDQNPGPSACKLFPLAILSPASQALKVGEDRIDRERGAINKGVRGGI